VNPIYEEQKEFGSRTGGAEALAMLAGREVVRTAKEIETQPGGPVRAAQRVATAPGKRYMGLLGYDPRYDELAKGDMSAPDTPIRMSALRVGKIAFACSNGELFSEIGRDVKARSPYTWTVVMGLTNGYASYILSDREISRGGYEYNASVVREGGQKTVVETLVNLLEGL
jgi:hypothetical protein